MIYELKMDHCLYSSRQNEKIASISSTVLGNMASGLSYPFFGSCTALLISVYVVSSSRIADDCACW